MCNEYQKWIEMRIVDCNVKLYQGCKVKVVHLRLKINCSGGIEMYCKVKIYQFIMICYNELPELKNLNQEVVHYGINIRGTIND